MTDAQLRALPDVSFMAEDTRRLWTQLVGGKSVKPRDPPVWKAYQQHVEYRNRIAHGDLWGDSVGFWLRRGRRRLRHAARRAHASLR